MRMRMSRCPAFEMSGPMLGYRIGILMFWVAFTGATVSSCPIVYD